MLKQWDTPSDHAPCITTGSSSTDSNSDIQSYSDDHSSGDNPPTQPITMETSHPVAMETSQAIAPVSSDKEEEGGVGVVGYVAKTRGCGHAGVRRRRKGSTSGKVGVSNAGRKIGSFLSATPIKNYRSKVRWSFCL